MIKNLLIGISCLLMAETATAQITVKNLLTENQTNPINVDTGTPRFSWQLAEAHDQPLLQQAYEIQVDSVAATGKVGHVWASGKIVSGQSNYVPYQGKALKSTITYFWKVRIWDDKGKSSGWSKTASWKMGLLSATDWQAKWIEPNYKNAVNDPAPLMRTTFSIKKNIREATAYITSHGFYEAQINGHKVGDSYLNPGWTSYNKRLQYRAYDVKSLLTAGNNAIGVTLGSGWYRSPLGPDHPEIYGKTLGLLLQIKIIYSDGSEKLITSDENWKSSTGALRSAEIYNGCTIDSRLEQKGWANTGFNDQAWTAVKVLPYPKTTFVAAYNEPVKLHETFKPIKLITTPRGEKVIDFGQNLVGWVRVTLRGRAGDSVRLSHAEVLDKAGNFYTENLRAAKAQNVYILKDNSPQTFEPQFTWQGFRYIKVEGIAGNLNPDDFTAVAIYSDMKPTGSFACSNPTLNQLQHNIQWGQKGNFLDVPTDCPQRDERLGWTGDAQVFAHTASYNMDVHNFFSKWMKDVAADQHASGSVPYVIPDVFSTNGKEVGGSTGWADVATIVPYNMYLTYGDTRILEEQFASMQAWVGYIQKHTKNDLWTGGSHFGDWLFYSVNDDRDGNSAITSKYLIAQCFYAYSTQLLINTAKVLGKTAEEQKYTELLSKIKSAFLSEYVTPNGLISSDTQTAYALALQFDMLPENLRAQAAARLAKNIRQYNNHLTTGFLGTPYVCDALTKFGYPDVAYQLLLQDTYPSWLYPIKNGATTIWERWDGIRPDGSFENPSMNSYNHYAYGAIGDWMYQNIAGIQAGAPGYRKIVIKPIIGGKLTWAEGSYDCSYGNIYSKWQITDGKLSMTVRIPQNTTAEIFVPDAQGKDYQKYTVKAGSYTYNR